MAGESSKVSWIAATEEAVRLARNAAEAQRQIADLEDARTSLARLVTEFSALSVGASVVRPFGWEGWTPSPELARDFTEAARTLDSRPLNRVVAALERFKTDVRSALVERWGVHASKEIGDVSELLVLAETLTGVEGVAELSQELQTILGKLARMQRAVPSMQAMELLLQARETLRKLEESLRPDSVRRFLSAVARGGASTNLLTKDVIGWLKSHKALSSFKIVAGPPTPETDVEEQAQEAAVEQPVEQADFDEPTEETDV